MPADKPPLSAAEVAQSIAASLDARGQEYALGGAIALGYWGTPRGTVDVDVTLYVAPEKPSECLWLLQDLGCVVETTAALESLREHGFCQVHLRGVRLDVFLPTLAFYDQAKPRRRRVLLGGQTISIWDAETLTVFKMMFFRRKDIADVEQILRMQGPTLDRAWIRCRIEELYGRRDPRLAQWDQLVTEIPITESGHSVEQSSGK